MCVTRGFWTVSALLDRDVECDKTGAMVLDYLVIAG